MNKEYKFSAAELEAQISHLKEKKITELTVTDPDVASNKQKLLSLINKVLQFAPDIFVSFTVNASVLDREVAAAAQNIFCSFEIPLVCSQKGGKLLFDKKFYAGKLRLLNDLGLVFGLDLTYAISEGDSLKAFMDRLDFAIQQYPNHINFVQTETAVFSGEMQEFEPHVTGTFSAKDIRYARDLAFACRTFYSSGRAVPWFLSVLKPLKIYPSCFFADFAEWQRCNNCCFKSGFNPEAEKHVSIEKMQLLFLDEKYEEKHCHPMVLAMHDIVRLNGAMSRLVGEDEESVVKTSYNPEDIFGPESMDLVSFCENVCMEECNVKVFFNGNSPDFALK